ncbi:sulfatase [Streptomyces sp. NBC_01387]|uniref:sulfatase n=2 Tax=unclassified Streptomyces TaxID=2593676 RepID=UPI002025836C|nr:sulfatase [Streptomyces sp. NBC_01766]MCX4547658.1 sulfatase [Streptomyces sp. NBC_01500]WSC19347.1 sulfatase [Streptomyces sp. NBC_01766]WSV53369.1 sulfatase [Streptomyces sp. NBC_01014]
MRAIMVMFDSLNRHMLPPYGGDWTHAPNFARLAEKAVTFDNAYAGSMPCMPARRELHTGRHNFLHRSWGPLEPFDDSMPELLKQNGVYTHLVSDHPHYWEDGGATYHGRYNTWEFFRGQEGDPWKGQVADPEIPDDLKRVRFGAAYRQDWVNRPHMATEDRHPQTLTFDAGLDFVRTNQDADRWFVQIETFDPHEPFFSHQQYKDLYPHDYEGPHFDWPDYKRVVETDGQVEHARFEYGALLSMCDHSLGRVLDTMDELELWDDTLLIVNTDHGLLLGEKGWWGKSVQPWFNELVHLPLFAWDPRNRVAGERRSALVQTVDVAPTFLEFFGVDRPGDMQGAPLPVAEDTPVREAGLFGIHGGHVNVTDGRYVYMRAPASSDNAPLYEHTLMPTHMRGRFSPAELVDLELAEPFDFTKNVCTLRVPGRTLVNPYHHGTLLFDLETDPEQHTPLVDDAAELRMATLLVELMRTNDAPPSQYERLGLPAHGPVTEKHLLVRAQCEQAERAAQPLPRAEDFPEGRLSLRTPLVALISDPVAVEVLRRHLPGVADSELLQMIGATPLIDVAAMAGALFPPSNLRLVAEELAQL